MIDRNASAPFWGGGTFAGNPSLDVYGGAHFAFAAALQPETMGVTNCPNTY